MTKGISRPISRRAVMRGAAGTAALAAGVAGFPAILRAQAPAIKVGSIQPVTGGLAFSGTQARLGFQMAVEEINAAGGIKSMGGARIEPLLGDAQSKPDVGVQEVEKMNEAGAAAVIGAFASGISLATTQAAARYNLPHLVDVGVADDIVKRGLKNTFRFGPGFGVVSETAIENLVKINEAAGKPAKTVMIVHEDSLFGSGLAKLLNERLPQHGFEVLETIGHPTPTRDFANVVLKIRARNPDLVIPANYYNEYILLARTMQQQRVSPKAIYSVLGGAASNLKFVSEFPDAAQFIMDCNHWYNPKSAQGQAFREKVEKSGNFFTYEAILNYANVYLLADALERAGRPDREAIIDALSRSTFEGHIMPYGPTRFVDGQNQGARPVNTQVIEKDVKVIFPAEFASAKPVFPMPSRG
jgi:branched-chain amino acid transport system substrate-binding protein